MDSKDCDLKRLSNDFDWHWKDGVELIPELCKILREERGTSQRHLMSSQVMQGIGYKTKFPLSRNLLEKYESLVDGAMEWIIDQKAEFKSVVPELTTELTILRNLLQFLLCMVRGSEWFCIGLIQRRRYEQSLLDLCDPSSQYPLWISRICLDIFLPLMYCRQECSEIVPRDILQQYVKIFKHLLSLSEPVILFPVVEFLNLLTKCDQPFWQLNLVGSAITCDNLTLLIELLNVTNRQCKRMIFDLIGNLCFIPTLWKEHKFFCDNKTLLASIGKQLRHKSKRTKCSALSALSRLLSTHNLSFVERVVEKHNILFSLYTIFTFDENQTSDDNSDDSSSNDEKEEKEEKKIEKDSLPSRKYIHIRHYALAIVLKIFIQAPSTILDRILQQQPNIAAEAFFLVPKHRLECPCELFPQQVTSAIDRLLGHFPDCQSEALKVALQDVERLPDECYRRYARRSKLLLERYFYRDCLYNI